MSNIAAFAEFLRDYGAYAMASVFAALYALERRERRTTQEKYERYLEATPAQLREFADAQSQAVENLRIALFRAGISQERKDDANTESPTTGPHAITPTSVCAGEARKES